MKHKREEQLSIFRRIGVTKPVYDTLRRRKNKTKFSMAKILCNLVAEAEKKWNESQTDKINDV